MIQKRKAARALHERLSGELFGLTSAVTFGKKVPQ